MQEKDTDVLLLDEELEPAITDEAGAALKLVMDGLMEAYKQNQDTPIKEWLEPKLQENLPDKEPEEIKCITKGIIVTLETVEEKKQSLTRAVDNGIGKESWFATETQKAVSAMSAQDTVKYLVNLDDAVRSANEAFEHTIRTQAGVVSQNPNLDGFIAEQYHAQTFNLNAEASGSQYRARVLEPDGKPYAKNSVDIVIEDGSGKIVRKYQSKYCKDAKASEIAVRKGDYSFQRKLIPEGQQEQFAMKCSTVLEAPDGTTSKPLTKTEAKQRQYDVQAGKIDEFGWNEYQTKDLARGMAKNAGSTALQEAVIGAGLNIAQKLWNGEDVDGEEVVETALVSGMDTGVKAAAAGAVKIGAEKGLVPAVLKETSVAASVAFVAIENVKVVGEMMSGELTGKEGLEKMEQTTVATVAGLSSMGTGAGIGAAVGAVLGPVGAAVGGFIGGTVAYMAGSKIGQTVVKGFQKLRDCVVSGVKTVVGGALDFIGGIFDTVTSFLFW